MDKRWRYQSISKYLEIYLKKSEYCFVKYKGVEFTLYSKNEDIAILPFKDFFFQLLTSLKSETFSFAKINRFIL